MRLNQLMKKLRREKPSELEQEVAEVSEIVQGRMLLSQTGHFPIPKKEYFWDVVKSYISRLKKKKPVYIKLAPSPELAHLDSKQISEEIEYASRIVQERMNYWTP